jgi:hypothetical protein
MSLSFNEHDIFGLNVAKVCIISLTLLWTYIRTLTQDESFDLHVDPLKTKGNKSTFMSSGPRILKEHYYSRFPGFIPFSFWKETLYTKMCVGQRWKLYRQEKPKYYEKNFSQCHFLYQKSNLENNDRKSRTQTSAVRSWRVSVGTMARSFKNQT